MACVVRGLGSFPTPAVGAGKVTASPWPWQILDGLVGTRVRIPLALRTANSKKAAAESLQHYFLNAGKPNARFEGSWFDRLDGGGSAPSVANTGTGADVAALAFLSVPLKAQSAHGLTVGHGVEIEAMLAAIEADRGLVDVHPDEVKPGWPAWDLYRYLIDNIANIGPTRASKFLARKRPRQVPVRDSQVITLIPSDSDESLWVLLARRLRNARSWTGPKSHDCLIELRTEAGTGDGISAIRVFDILAWLAGSVEGPKTMAARSGVEVLCVTVGL